MWKWITGTVRPITFLAGIPVVVGALVSHSRIDWNIIYPFFGAMLAVGFANSFNSLIDRCVDRLNPEKKTLAVNSPIAAWYSVLFLLPVLAICLRSQMYNHCLLAVLYYLSHLYSYLFGVIPIIKRIVVAAVIASTLFLAVPTPNMPLWLLAAVLFLYMYKREGNKDNADKMEDDQMKFAWLKTRLKLDWWCITAPLLGAGLYLGSFGLVGHHIGLIEIVIAFGLSLTIWSYLEIRFQYKCYRMRLAQGTMGGRLGTVIALVGLMPSFVSPLFLLLALINASSIVGRSFLGKRIVFTSGAILHDAYLWASIPLLAATAVGFPLILLVCSIGIGCIVFFHERKRLCSHFA